MRRFATLCATLALAGAVAAPAGAVTSSANGSITFDTALTPQFYGAGEYDGVLHLSFRADGIVNGWYRPVDSGTIRTVVGGLDGDRLWLDLGGGALGQVNGTYDDGKIVASTYTGGQLYEFKATPAKS